jgi:hypothetical protein
MRQEKHMYLHTVSFRTKIPQRMIEGMENGKFLKRIALRRLLEFYGKRMQVVFK